MSLKMGDAPKSYSLIAPAGNHVARCFSIVDTGTHTETGQFGTKTARKIRISWELPDELHVFQTDKGEQPFSVHKTYTFSVHEKSNFRKDLESWRGRPFTESELTDFEIKNLLGAACLLNVVHTVKPAGTYANIDGIAPMPKAMKANMPAAINKPVYYEITDGRNAVFESLPEFLREIISKSREFTGGGEEPIAREPADQDGGEGPEIAF